MSTQHTPGPWHVANGVQIRSERHQIAKVWMMRNGEGTANARLIAAAPDMYEALKSIVEDHDFCGDDWGDRRDAWIEAARAVLAKAEGKP